MTFVVPGTINEGKRKRTNEFKLVKVPIVSYVNFFF